MRWIARIGVGLGVAVVLALVTIGRPADWLPDAISDDGPDPDQIAGVVYLVEIASRPDYRLVERDLETGATLPLLVVPDTGVVSSVTPSADGASLVLAYSRDYREPGTGLYHLPLVDPAGRQPSIDLGDGALEPLLAERSDAFFDDLVIGPDGGTVWASLDEEGAPSVVGVDPVTGEIAERIDDAVAPAPGPGWLAYLIVEPDGSRRSIGLLDSATGRTSIIDVLDRRYDLGILVADGEGDRLLVTALVPEGRSVIELGDPASAHGPHDGPAQWLSVDVDGGTVERLVEHEPTPMRDAALLGDGGLVAITGDGLVLVGEPMELVVESRVLGEVAG